MWVKSLIYLLSHLLTAISVANARCYNTGNFTTNSTYGRNRDLILSFLPANVSANGGFFTVTIGQDPNKVYALGLCRGDSSPQDCFSYLNSTIHDLVTNCPNQKEALSWGNYLPSLVHYADRSFFGILELDPTDAGTYPADIKSNLTEFNQLWEDLMESMVKKASMGSSKLNYAAAIRNYTYFQNIYAMMQCTPDLSQSDCETCLTESVGTYQRMFYGKQGGFVMKPNCWFRWELYPFFKENNSGTDPSLSPQPSRPHSTNTTITNEKKSSRIPLVASLSAALGLTLFSVCGFFIWRRRFSQEDTENSQEVHLHELVRGTVHNGERSTKSQEFPSIKLDTLHAATNHFSVENKLGQGGFGPVYKGVLPDGKEIAVKRLSKSSRQGLLEFKNEVILIAKLQHKNLVRLLGCCLEKDEKLLVYEFMPNRSLDVLLFDSNTATQLDWQKRSSIIKGIARGVMYLHEDSRLRIIHRDLKASNVLLDHEMNPKISDFGMARIFSADQNDANTNRVVGTYGYMAPEYAMEGQFSIKSDVFSFGVLLLEIICGKKSNAFHLSGIGESLLTCAWKLWSKGEGMELVDQTLSQSCIVTEVLKCIHIGLLCVQDDPANRPSMTSVVFMLASETITLPQPSEPAYFVRRRAVAEPSPTQQATNNGICSVNEVTFSNMSPR